MSGLGEQFAHPKGLLGALAGRIMARSNRELGAWAVSLLDLGPDDRVLEVGFGPGVAARMVLERVPGGFLVGVDASEEMVRQATKRNARAVNEGRADLKHADVSELLGSGSPFGRPSGEPFDALLSINSVPFWDEPVACLRGLRGLLRGGGLAVLAVQPRTRGATGATTREVGEGLAGDLLAAGFVRVRQEIREMRPVPAVCVLGAAPDSGPVLSAPADAGSDARRTEGTVGPEKGNPKWPRPSTAPARNPARLWNGSGVRAQPVHGDRDEPADRGL